MADQQDSVVKPDDSRGHRFDHDQPLVLPGVRRYQFFTNLKDRMLTKHLNRLSIFGLTASVGVAVTKPVINGTEETIYCYECRKCYATKEKCPAGITYQAELTIAARVADYHRFLRNGGLKCIRCGNCIPFCVLYLNLPDIFGTMQRLTVKALEEGKIPSVYLEKALEEGRVGAEFIDRVASLVEKGGGKFV
ncbi:MAG: hypothetical protein ACYDG6_06040 [Thermincolia bacterium]